MIRERLLGPTTEKISAFIDKCVTRAGAEHKDEVLELFDSTIRLFPHWVIMTCPMLHPDFYYISKNGSELFGYSNEYLSANLTMKKSFDFVHEDDSKDLADCIAFMHDFLHPYAPEDHHLFRTILHYRFKRADGEYIYLHDERACLKLKGTGNLYYTLYKDVSSEKTFTGVKAEFFKQKDTLRKIREYKPSASLSSLSKREMELVTLIRQGLSTKEIAWQLNISHHTVRNIKSKLFEKYKVSNSIELLNVAG